MTVFVFSAACKAVNHKHCLQADILAASQPLLVFELQEALRLRVY